MYYIFLYFQVYIIIIIIISIIITQYKSNEIIKQKLIVVVENIYNWTKSIRKGRYGVV